MISKQKINYKYPKKNRVDLMYPFFRIHGGYIRGTYKNENKIRIIKPLQPISNPLFKL